MCLTSRRSLYVDTFRLSRPAKGARPRVGFWGHRDDGTVQATGLEGTATRRINRHFSGSFLRHFNSAELPEHVGSESGTRGNSTTARCISAW
jgi:hypothetical protein